MGKVTKTVKKQVVMTPKGKKPSAVLVRKPAAKPSKGKKGC